MTRRLFTGPAALLLAGVACSMAGGRQVTIPAGAAVSLTLDTPVSSDGSKPEDVVRAHLSKAIVIDAGTVVPEGANVVGSVIEANMSGRVQGLASVSFRFDRMTIGDQLVDFRTTRITREAAPTKKKDAEKIGIGAGAGALVGAIAGGKKGALIGTGVGAGAGTGVVLATRGDEVRLGVGTVVRATLEQPVQVLVPVKQGA